MTSTLSIQQAVSLLVIEDEEGSNLVIETKGSALVSILDAGIQGPPGPRGSSGTDPLKFDFISSANWTGSHSLGRIPIVTSFLEDGEVIIADVHVTDINFSVQHAVAQSGFVLLS